MVRHRERGVTARCFLAALAAVVLAACSATPATPSAPTGPLEERIWDVRAGRFISEEQLALRLRRARYRLLGEVHDHPAHHRLRAALIGQLAAPGESVEVYFEQFDREYDAALREAQHAGADADALAGAGRLGRNWNWPLHRPLVAAALTAKYPVRAANLAEAETRRIAKAGALGPADAALAGALAKADWSAAREKALREDVFESHCGALPEKFAPAMALAQRARDAALALALAAAPGGAVLVAGNGHVRRDLGVPLYLPREASVASVGFLETRAAKSDPRAYARSAAGEQTYDFVWFTAPQPRPDPCEALRKRRSP
jgi:uncharacterized iron-regulated protein